MNKKRKGSKKTRAKPQTSQIRFVDPKSLGIYPGVEIVPRPTQAEYAELRADIATFGVKEPLDVIGDQVDDGLTRLDIALKDGLLTVPVREIVLGEGETPVAYAIKKAKLRRRLTDDQVAMLAAELAELTPEQRGGERKGPKGPPRQGIAARNPTVAKRATEVGATLYKSLKARKLRKQNPRLAKQVKTGELTLREAQQEAGKEEAAQATDSLESPVGESTTVASPHAELMADAKAVSFHIPRLVRVLEGILAAITDGTLPWPLPRELALVEADAAKIADRVGAIRHAAAQQHPEAFGAAAAFRPPAKPVGGAGSVAPASAPNAAPPPVPAPAPFVPSGQGSSFPDPNGPLGAVFERARQATAGEPPVAAPAPVQVPASAPVAAPAPVPYVPKPYGTPQ